MQNKKKIKEFTKNHAELPPSKIQLKYVKENLLEEDISTSNFPTRKQIENIKKTEVNAGDKIHQIITTHGYSFSNSTKFILFYSVEPFIVIMTTEFNENLKNERNVLLCFDDTHSCCKPKCYLLNVMLCINGRGNFFIYSYLL